MLSDCQIMLGFKVASNKSTPFEPRELHTLTKITSNWMNID